LAIDACINKSIGGSMEYKITEASKSDCGYKKGVKSGRAVK